MALRNPKTASEAFRMYLDLPLYKKSVSAFKNLMKKVQIPPTDREMREILYEAVKESEEEIVHSLLADGVDQNKSENWILFTPIFSAIISENVSMCHLLIFYGANLYHESLYKCTPHEMILEWIGRLTDDPENADLVQGLLDLSGELEIKEPA